MNVFKSGFESFEGVPEDYKYEPGDEFYTIGFLLLVVAFPLSFLLVYIHPWLITVPPNVLSAAIYCIIKGYKIKHDKGYFNINEQTSCLKFDREENEGSNEKAS
ncbi:MAG: hypothetical protein ACFFCS_02965 [Candidatus Hodarchaeota archaeon]